MSLIREFISRENVKYPFQLGRTLASGLTGFIFGAAFASIIWYVVMTVAFAQ